MKKTIEDYIPLIQQYRKEHPYLSKRKLGQLIKDEENLPYTIGTIRKFIGHNAEPDYDDVWKKDEFFIDMPETWYKEKTIFPLPKAMDNMLIIADLQMPFHDKRAIQAALRYGYDENVNGILINGDLADCYSVSHFIKGPKYRDLEAEVHSVISFLKGLRKAFPDIPIYWKKGNHEIRLDAYISEKAPDLAWYSGLSTEELFDLKSMDVKVISGDTIMQYGQLYILHGHEYKGGGSINIARNMLLKAFDNILCSHFHRVDETYWTPIGGNSIGAWVTGCLCGLKPDYLPLNNWVHGLARVTRNDDDTFEVFNRKMLRGKIF